MLQEMEAAAARVEWSAILYPELSFAHPRIAIRANLQDWPDPRTRHLQSASFRLLRASHTILSDCQRPKVFTLVRLQKTSIEG